LLDVHNVLGRITLTVNSLVSPKFSDLSCRSRSIEKGLRLARFRLGFLDFHTGTDNGPTAVQQIQACNLANQQKLRFPLHSKPGSQQANFLHNRQWLGQSTDTTSCRLTSL